MTTFARTRRLAIAPLLSFLVVASVAVPAFALEGGTTTGCPSGQYKPYRSDGTTGSCRPFNTGASWAWTTASSVDLTSCRADLAGHGLCARAKQTDRWVSRATCAGDPDLDPEGVDRDCYEVAWSGSANAKLGTIGEAEIMFPGHESTRSCSWSVASLATSCSATGKTHNVWHGPDDVYSKYKVRLSWGDGVYTTQCHETHTEAQVTAPTFAAQSSPVARVCFWWTNHGY